MTLRPSVDVQSSIMGTKYRDAMAHRRELWLNFCQANKNLSHMEAYRVYRKWLLENGWPDLRFKEFKEGFRIGILNV